MISKAYQNIYYTYKGYIKAQQRKATKLAKYYKGQSFKKYHAVTKEDRFGQAYWSFRRKVFKRDKHKCQSCYAGNKGVKLELHHIKPWFNNKLLRFKMDNCTTLCVDCHTIFFHALRVDLLPSCHHVSAA